MSLRKVNDKRYRTNTGIQNEKAKGTRKKGREKENKIKTKKEINDAER